MTSLLAERFRNNLDRVRGLLASYDAITGAAPGRPTVREADLLRAAVVLLHATLEDLLRGVAASRLPHSTPEILARVPLVGGDGRRTTLTLGDLAAHRGRSVADVISDSVEAHLGRTSYNGPGDIARALLESGLDPGLIGPVASELATMMKRRHHVVHQLDRDPSPGRGRHWALSISKATVESWIGLVERFGSVVISSL